MKISAADDKLRSIVAPPNGYLQQVAVLCRAHNVLFVCDEVQSGLGRAGANLCHLREGVRPDLVVLGKALAGGANEYCLGALCKY